MMVVFLLLLTILSLASAEVITRLPTKEKVVAITLDACETKTPSYLDWKIINYLMENRIPFTIFVSGKFLIRNRKDLERIYRTGLVSIQNHSMNHYQHMERLSKDEVIRELEEVEALIYQITGKRSLYFRFPGGNYDSRSLSIVESLGYKVVHWTFPSGDPDKRITPEMLHKHVVRNTVPGSILIFHVNGRGYSTGEALPRIVEDLKKQGYRFVRLEDYIK